MLVCILSTVRKAARLAPKVASMSTATKNQPLEWKLCAGKNDLTACPKVVYEKARTDKEPIGCDEDAGREGLWGVAAALWRHGRQREPNAFCQVELAVPVGVLFPEIKVVSFL